MGKAKPRTLLIGKKSRFTSYRLTHLPDSELPVIQQADQTFQDYGFEFLGDLYLSKIKGLTIYCYINHKLRAVAVIVKYKDRRYASCKAIDIATDFHDGVSLSTTNRPMLIQHWKPKTSKVKEIYYYSYPDANVTTLLDKHQQHLYNGDRVHGQRCPIPSNLKDFARIIDDDLAHNQRFVVNLINSFYAEPVLGFFVAGLIIFLLVSPTTYIVTNSLQQLWGKRSPDCPSVKLPVGVSRRYQQLYNCLTAEDWESSDRVTDSLLVESSGQGLNKWVPPYAFADIPCEDLQQINQLWLNASDGKFGLSVQEKLYQQKGYTEMAQEVGWLNGETVTFPSRLESYNATSSPMGQLPAIWWLNRDKFLMGCGKYYECRTQAVTGEGYDLIIQHLQSCQIRQET